MRKLSYVQFREEVKDSRKRYYQQYHRFPVLQRHIPQYPFLAEEKLRRTVTDVMTYFFAGTYAILDSNPIKLDSPESEFVLELQDIELEIQTANLFQSEGLHVRGLIEQIAEYMVVHAASDFSKYFIQFLDQEFVGTNLWWSTVRDKWISLLDQRVRGTMGQMITSARDTVFSMAREGKQFSEIQQAVIKLLEDVTETKAAFIARDLVGTLNSQIFEHTFTSLGFPDYLWFTQNDERVRGKPGGVYPYALPSHFDMHGKYCQWANSSVYSEDGGNTWIPRTERMPIFKPGEDWQCRCLAQPIIRNFLQEIDTEIKREV